MKRDKLTHYRYLLQGASADKLLSFSDPPFVSVKIAPGPDLDDLKEGDEVRLVCKVRANPAPTVVSWFHGVSYALSVSLHKILWQFF